MSVFEAQHPTFSSFLRDVASSEPGNGAPRIEARNFLLDSSVTEARAEGYCAEGADEGFADAGEWLGYHDDYVDDRVYLRRPRQGGAPTSLDPRKPTTCPETFREDDNFTDFGNVDSGLHLLRVLDLGDMIKRSRPAAAGAREPVGQGGRRRGRADPGTGQKSHGQMERRLP